MYIVQHVIIIRFDLIYVLDIRPGYTSPQIQWKQGLPNSECNRYSLLLSFSSFVKICSKLLCIYYLNVLVCKPLKINKLSTLLLRSASWVLVMLVKQAYSDCTAGLRTEHVLWTLGRYVQTWNCNNNDDVYISLA